mmetsp:Transcript_8982/g.28376  ORF Transcript_8982/g.28376 Transcript_8982/m.28376 type:complete len:340 (+) Transcript_8982:3-1022(+)
MVQWCARSMVSTAPTFIAPSVHITTQPHAHAHAEPARRWLEEGEQTTLLLLRLRLGRAGELLLQLMDLPPLLAVIDDQLEQRRVNLGSRSRGRIGPLGALALGLLLLRRQVREKLLVRLVRHPRLPHRVRQVHNAVREPAEVQPVDAGHACLQLLRLAGGQQRAESLRGQIAEQQTRGSEVRHQTCGLGGREQVPVARHRPLQLARLPDHLVQRRGRGAQQLNVALHRLAPLALRNRRQVGGGGDIGSSGLFDQEAQGPHSPRTLRLANLLQQQLRVLHPRAHVAEEHLGSGRGGELVVQLLRALLDRNQGLQTLQQRACKGGELLLRPFCARLHGPQV